jgi:hypothetical protein
MKMFQKIKRNRKPDDEFFEEGNLLMETKMMEFIQEEEEENLKIFCDFCEIYFESEQSFQV